MWCYGRKQMASENRQKTELIQVRCTQDEKLALKDRADAFSVSVGELCRQAIFSSVPKSKTDQSAIQQLAGTRADLGRLGGLFKGWLAGSFSQPGPGPKTHAEVAALLREIESGQQAVLDAVKRLSKP